MVHYLFVDEAVEWSHEVPRIAMSGWIVEKERFSSQFDSNSSLYRTPVLQSITSALEEVDGKAIVGNAALSSVLARSMERDSTDDISGMSRTDNIWSQSLIFLAASLIREMIRENRRIDFVDIFHDPKTLKNDHADAVHRTLRGSVVELAKQFTTQRNLRCLDNLEIRHITSVPKGDSNSRDALQKAIWIADRLCSFDVVAEISRSQERIIKLDMTELVTRTIRQFDGMPFDGEL